ncbi:hypothetical protein [Botrimarina mediterranea]|nr:hypothetical protein [Botrimarina mediterranea]
MSSAIDQHTLVVAEIVDAETGEPIEDARFFVGVGWLEASKGYSWQDHTITKCTAGKLQWPRDGRQGYDVQCIRIESPGYKPFVTVPIARNHAERIPDTATVVTPGQPVKLTIKLQLDLGIVGRVLTPDGEPARSAQVGITQDCRSITLKEGQLSNTTFWQYDNGQDIWDPPPLVQTDDEGRFALPDDLPPAGIVVAHASGFVTKPLAEYKAGDDLKLHPWGRIEGKLDWGVLPNAGVRLCVQYLNEAAPLIRYQKEYLTTDASGAFVIDKVPPGYSSFSHQVSEASHNWYGHPYQSVLVEAERAPTRFTLGRSTSIVGHLPAGLDYANITVRYAVNGHDGSTAYELFMKSKVGKLYRSPPVPVAVDGSFQFDGVRPEHYQLTVERRGRRTTTRLGGKNFSVRTLPDDEEAKPQDIGEVFVRDIPKAAVSSNPAAVRNQR